jgi:regulatory protein
MGVPEPARLTAVLITALERRPRSRWVECHLDGGERILLAQEVCAQFKLRVGSDLSDSILDELRRAQARHRAQESALRLLSYRPRSEAEIRTRLRRAGNSADAVAETLERLRGAGLIDDESFARDWVDGRQSRSPRGRRLLAAELHAHGIDRRIMEGAVSGVDDLDAAYRAAERRAGNLQSHPYSQFRQRLSGFLLRRGFDYETVRATVARLWEERSAADPHSE